MTGDRQGLTRALGVISGTSMDAIDIAIVETDGAHSVIRRGGAGIPYPPDLRADLLDILKDPGAAARSPLTEIETRATDAFSHAIRETLERLGIALSGIDVIGLHGQTIFHDPAARFTRQLGDGARMARALGVPVINRFRHADVEAGGQGAPLVPLYHAALVHGLAGPLAVLNLGGVANITYIDGQTIIACDTGPASALIDDAMRRDFGRDFDEGGAIARSGRVDEGALAALLGHPFFALRPPKSLDRNAFHALADEVLPARPEDRVATLTAFTIRATAGIVAQLPHSPSRWLVAGGGRHNTTFLDGFRATLGVPVETVEAIGLDGDLMEAECFGYLAVRSQRGLPLSLPTTTGVPAPMRGGVIWRL